MSKRGNGEGTIYYSQKLNRWCGQVTIGLNNNGNLKRKSVYGKTRKEVSEKILNLQTKPIIDKNKITVSELALEVINDKYNSNLVNLGTHTRHLYTLSLIDNPLKDMEIQKVKPYDIKQFLNSKTNYSNSTIEKLYQLLGVTFRRAIERDYITKNPMLFEEVKRPKSAKKDREVISLSIEEEKCLISHCGDKLYDNIILLMLFTGMRIGEVLALTWDDIGDTINIHRTLTRDKNDTFKIGETTKTENSKRSLTITPIVKKILDRLPKKDGLVFEKNGIIKPYEVNLYLRRMNQKYHIANSLHNHMLRHTYATRCIESGMNIKVLQKKLGHKNINTTLNTYASILDKFEKSEDEKLEDYLSYIKVAL